METRYDTVTVHVVLLHLLTVCYCGEVKTVEAVGSLPVALSLLQEAVTLHSVPVSVLADWTEAEQRLTSSGGRTV